MRKQIIAAALATALSVPAAQAAYFNFSYQLSSGDMLAGMIDGTLLGDGNSVVVGSILDFATFNSVSGTTLPFVESFDEYLGVAGALDPTVTFDGSFMDLIACESPACVDGFTFAEANAFSGGGPGTYISGASFGDSFEPFDASNWSLSTVSVPATLPLLLIGAAGLATWRRRED